MKSAAKNGSSKNAAKKRDSGRNPLGEADAVVAEPTPDSVPLDALVPDFDAKERTRLRDALQATVYDLVHLQLVTKQTHWNLVGPGFRAIHEFLDEIYAHVVEATDEVAERLVALGLSVEGQGPEVVRNTRVATIPSGFVRDLEGVRLMAERIKRTTVDIRAGLEPIEDVDTVTADLLHGVIEILEKDLWMLRAHLV